MEKKTWDEFRTTGLVVFVNQILHIFGWSIVFELIEDKVINCYPARVNYRGFDANSTDEAYKKITTYMVNNSKDLLDDVN